MITARHEYMDRPSLKSDLSCVEDQGVTKQSDLKDCDINAIFKRFEKTGLLPNAILKDGRYGDFSSVPDYQESLEIINHANEQFAMLDVEIRNRFQNSPEQFLAFVSDSKNVDELEKMGLLKPEVVAARAAARLAVDNAAAKKAADDRAAAKPAQ